MIPTLKRKEFFILIVIVTIFSLLPGIQMIREAHGWRGVIPEYTTDATFYLTRIVQVNHGYPFIGNPYIWEYRNAPALSFFFADWLAAIPLLFSSLTASVFFNLVIWSILFSIAAYILFLRLDLKPWESTVAAILSYFQVYWLMIRPVAMQTVFPVFILFLLAYVLWFRKPSLKLAIFLGISTAFIFLYLHIFVANSRSYSRTYVCPPDKKKKLVGY
jgi:hypothetical protein